MKNYPDAGPPPQTARANRERFAPVEPPAIMQEIAKTAPTWRACAS